MVKTSEYPGFGPSHAKPLPQIQQVSGWLRTEIVACRFLPDTKLNISSLAVTAKVSVGAVREALAALTAEGLVVSDPRRGYRVSPISGKGLSELVAARVEIEALCLKASLQHGDFRWESRCQDALSELNSLDQSDLGRRDSERRSSAHDEFHYALLSACPNHWFLMFQRQLYQQSERYRCLAGTLSGAPRDIATEHEELLNLALKREEAKAITLLSDHLLKTAKTLMRSPMLS